LHQQFCEVLDGVERVVEFVRHPAQERAKIRQSLCTSEVPLPLDLLAHVLGNREEETPIAEVVHPLEDHFNSQHPTVARTLAVHAPPPDALLGHGMHHAVEIIPLVLDGKVPDVRERPLLRRVAHQAGVGRVGVDGLSVEPAYADRLAEIVQRGGEEAALLLSQSLFRNVAADPVDPDDLSAFHHDCGSGMKEAGRAIRTHDPELQFCRLHFAIERAPYRLLDCGEVVRHDEIRKSLPDHRGRWMTEDFLGSRTELGETALLVQGKDHVGSLLDQPAVVRFRGGELQLGCFPLRDIIGYADELIHFALLVPDRGAARGDPPDRAVGVDDTIFDALRRPRLHPLHCSVHEPHVVRVYGFEEGRRVCIDTLEAEAEHRLVGSTDVDRPTEVLVEHPENTRHMLDESPEHLLACVQRIGRRLQRPMVRQALVYDLRSEVLQNPDVIFGPPPGLECDYA
jgi:hypothetical protein